MHVLYLTCEPSVLMATTAKNKRKRVVAEQGDTRYQIIKSKRKLLVGSKVEVRSLEEGWAGSWSCGTVVACKRYCRVVDYDHFYSDDKVLRNLKETVHVSPLLEGIQVPKSFNYRGIIRPIPPPCENEAGTSLSFGLCVDAFIYKAWWEGVIFSFEDELSERLVFFPDFPDLKRIKTDELRITQDWDEVDECWTVRGKWKFLELIEDYPIAVVNAAEIWDDLRKKEGFKNTIKEWTCNVKSVWVGLVVETISQYLNIPADPVYKVISGNYSVNDEDYGTNRGSYRDEEAVTRPSGASQQPKVNPEVGIIQEKRSRDENLKRKRKGYYPLSEENYSTKTKVSRPLSFDKCNTKDVAHSAKRAQKVVVPRSGHCSPRTILSWLIDNDVVLPTEKVLYLSATDDSAIGQGNINSYGIRCNCCHNVFGLYKFGLHIGSCYTPPSSRIYLEDGRSLLDCQKQLQEKCSNIYSQRSDLVHETNDDICSVCLHGGTLLMCDQCPSSFHLNCLGLEDVPDGNWFCPSCRCRICGQQSKLDCEKKSLRCDQCNHEYHVECVREGGLSNPDNNNQNSNWFCSITCEKIYVGLHKLFGVSVQVGKDNLSWTILKPTKDARPPFAPSEMEVVIECQSKLYVALAIMQECFEPIKDMRRDIIEDVVFNKTSELNRLNFRGFYTVILERDDEIISVAALRIHDEKLAEVPLVCTRFQYRRQGMCRTLFDVLEEKLRQLEVERVILPAIPQVLPTWTTSFGFSKLENSERLEFLDYTFLDFQDTTMCQKFLRKSSVSVKPTAEVPKESPRELNAAVQQLAGACTLLDDLATRVIQVERSEVTEQPLVVEVGAENVVPDWRWLPRR